MSIIVIFCYLFFIFLLSIGNSHGFNSNSLNTRKYLIEWRGIESEFRLNEFSDACTAVLGNKYSINNI